MLAVFVRIVVLLLGVLFYVAPALAQVPAGDPRWGVINKIAGRTYVNAGPGGSTEITYQVENGKLKECRKYSDGGGGCGSEYYPGYQTANGRGQRYYQNGWEWNRLQGGTGPSLQYAYLDENGDIVTLTRWNNFSYSRAIWADTTKGDAAGRANAGSLSFEKPDQSAEAGELFKQVGAGLAKNGDFLPALQLASSVQTDPKPITPTAAVSANGKRIALVLGNGSYGAAFGTLANAPRDAEMVAGALRTAGFDVEVVLNADQRTMKQAIARLGTRLSRAGRGATGLFYYAGHGLQSKGSNYLVPVNADMTTEADVDLDGVAADAVLSQMESAGAATNIVILDACRNMPLSRATRSGTRGLARMEAPNGSFLSYSTAPGAVAADGAGRNSPFATALVAEMQKPGQLIESVFRNVRRQVIAATNGAQTPWDSSSLVDSFTFRP